MEISGLFPSSDNLYKFLFMGGIFMIAFSFIYPLEKKQAIELDINNYNQQIEILNSEIIQLKKDVDDLKKNAKVTYANLEKQNLITKPEIAKVNIQKLKDDFNKSFAETKSKENEVVMKSILLKYEKEKISLLQKHIDSFSFFRWTLLLLGSVFTFFGLLKWFYMTKTAEDLQKMELIKRKKETYEN